MARRVTRILGVDLGSKRIGLAVADAGIGIARPLSTVNRGATLDDDVDALGGVCREQDVTELVIGLPIEAERRLGRMPRGRSGGPPSRTQRNAYRARIDREAASVILQDELDARGAVGPSTGTEER